MEKPYVSRKEQAQQTKGKIFDTTKLLIKKRGYSKITIREICQSAQISVGTFYLYFSSKDEILLEIYNRIDQKVVFPEYVSSNNTDLNCICEDFSVYLNYMAKTQEKELLREIYRNALISGDNRFLSPDSPLYQRILIRLLTAESDGKLLCEEPASQICLKIFRFVQSYILQWLINDDLTASFLTDTCLIDLGQYLSLFLP